LEGSGHISVFAWILSLIISAITAIITGMHGKPTYVVVFWFFAVLAACFTAINQGLKIYDWSRKRFPKEQPNIIVHTFEAKNVVFRECPEGHSSVHCIYS